MLRQGHVAKSGVVCDMLRINHFFSFIGASNRGQLVKSPTIDQPSINASCPHPGREGFLRSDTALIQTTGRAARHVNGTVIMYADRTTNSMRRAIDETDRRREVQAAYNETHAIAAASIVKAVRDLTDRVRTEADITAEAGVPLAQLPPREMRRIVRELEKQMKAAADDLEFEKAALLRDQILELRAALVEQEAADAPAWERERRRARLGVEA